MSTISRILQYKGSHVLTATSLQTVYDAVKEMDKNSVGALVVIDYEQVLGMVSERDYLQKIILQGRSSQNTPVRAIMSTPAICAAPNWSLEYSLRIMTERRFRHLSVMWKGRLLGLISIGDVVKALIDDQKFLIDQLSGYIQIGVAS